VATKRLEVLITGNAKDAQKAFGDLEKSATRSGKGTTKALGGIKSGLIGLGVGAAALGSFKAFEESEKISRQTAAVIKSTGNEANVTADHIGDLAAETSKLGGVDDELVQSGENMLLTFTNIRNEAGKGNDIFDQATRAANDYAAATGTDVVNANKMLGKALNDPIKGMSALTKAGVSFTQQQKDQIGAMVASGDTMGAQKIILAEFSKEYGGSLEANATASGKAQVAMENLGEAAGGILAPGLELLAGAATSGAEGLAALPEGAQQAIVGISGITVAAAYAGPKVIEMAGNMKDGAVAAKNWAGKMNEAGNLSKFGAGLGVAAAGVGAFTVTLELLNRAAETGIDVDGLSTDLVQLGKGASGVTDITDTMGLSVEDLAATFGQASDAPKDYGDSLGYLASHVTTDFGGTGMKQSLDTIKDLDAALAQAVTSGNADQAQKAYAKVASSMMEQGVSAEQVATQLPAYWTEMERADRANGGYAGAAVEAATATQDVADKAKEAGERTKEAAVSHERNARGLKAIADQAAAATSAIRDYYDEITGQVSTQIDAERALDDVTQSFKDNGTVLDISVEKGRQNREAIIAAKDAQLEYAMTLRDTSGTGAAIESMVNYSTSLYDTLVQAGLTKDQATALIDEMGLTPTDIYTQFRSNSSEAELKAAAVRKSIEDVPGWKDIYFNAMTEDALNQIKLLGTVVDPLIGSVLSGTAGAAIQQSQAAHKGKASGGGVVAGQLYPINERGLELFRPGVSGAIVPAHQTKQILSGTSVNGGGSGGSGNVYNINVTEARDGKATARDVIAEINRQTRMGGRPLVDA